MPNQRESEADLVSHRPPALAKLRTTCGALDAGFDAHLTKPLLQTRFEARQIKEVSSQ